MKPTLYLMMGLPGAGKTTVAKIIEKTTGAVRLSSDEARLMLWPDPDFSQEEHDALYEYLDDQTKHLLETGKSVIYDANLNRYMHREEKYRLAKECGAAVALLWIDTLKSTAKHRRLEAIEHHALVPPNEDPGSMFERIADLIEAPREGEACVKLDGNDMTLESVKTALRIK